MAMSKDAVEFYPNSPTSETDNLIQTLSDTMGISKYTARTIVKENAMIRCRPSQFARFIILRNTNQMTNGLRNLNPKLFTVDRIEVTDVTQNHT
jgi:hypothetical protein